MEKQKLKFGSSTLLFGALIVLSFVSMAQEPCGTDLIHRKRMEMDPTYAKQIKLNELLLQKAISEGTFTSRAQGCANYTVPLVVHVIHLGEAVGTGTNISDAQIQSSVDALNDAFRKKAGTMFDGNGVDTGIEFCLAKKDPSGNPTTGIVRVNGTGTLNYENVGVSMSNDQAIKLLSIWPNTQYYNIWVVSEIDNNEAGGGIQGYAYFAGAPAPDDGTIILYNSMGFDPGGTMGYNLKSYTNLNTTMIHEMGHALNLYHTFEGDGGGSSCPPNTSGACATEGDLCCDIPPHMRSNSNCLPDGTANTCSPGSTALDYQHNYMDYSSDACTNMFSADQSARMNAVLATSRNSLVTNTNLSNCGCNRADIAIEITSGTNPTCLNQAITFTAKPENGGCGPTYQWYKNGVVIAGETGITYTTATLTNETITCVMTSNLAGVINSPATSNAITISMNSTVIPTLSVGFSAGADTVCIGTSVTFTTTPVNGGLTPTYQWFVNGSSVLGETNSSYTTTLLADNDVVTCELTSSASCPSPATVGSSGITMTIIPAVIPAISVAISSGSATICAGSSVSFSATPLNEGSTPSYQWQINGSDAGTNSPSFSSTALLNGDVVTCILSSNATCASPSTITSNIVTMTVNPVVSPTVAVAITAGTNPTCASSHVTFTASSSNGGSSPLYQWSLNGVNTIIGSTYTLTTPADGDVVTCTVTSNASCLSTSTATSSGTTVSIIPSPEPTVSVAITSGTNPSCIGASLTLAATAVNAGNTPLYQWFVDGNQIVGAQNQTYTPTTLTDGEVISCEVTSSAVCPDVSTSNEITIVVPPIASISFIADIDACSGNISEMVFISQPQGADFNWVNSNTAIGLAASGIGNVPAFTSSNTGAAPITSTITVTPSIGGCTGIVETYTITINPTPEITQTGNVLTSTTSSSYQWYKNGAPIMGATNQSYTVLTNGEYAVIIDGGECPSESVFITTAAIDELNNFDSFNVYPNPSDGSFIVSFNSLEKQTYSTAIVNALGALVYKEVSTEVLGNYSKSIDVKTFGKGLYMIHLSDFKTEQIKKVVVY
jgi:hypothetical protein